VYYGFVIPKNKRVKKNHPWPKDNGDNSMVFLCPVAFYSGAMTMFFTNAVNIKFLDTVDVFNAYPDWNLIFLSGNTAKFVLKAEYDPDYAKYWARVKASPRDYTYNSIEEGLSLIAKQKMVMQIGNDKLNGHLIANTQVQKMESIVIGINLHSCIAFPFNSPLKPLFDKAIMQARESGVKSNLIKQWMGANINNAGVAENAILSAGQLILVFVGMMVAFSICLVIVCAELAMSMMNSHVHVTIFSNVAH
jgi:hypothetical protein